MSKAYECQIDVCGWRGTITQLEASREYHFCPLCGEALLMGYKAADTPDTAVELERIAAALEALGELLEERTINVAVIKR